MLPVFSSLCPTGIPKIVGKCSWVHKKDMHYFVSRLHNVGSPTGRKGASLLCSAFSSSFFHALDNQRLHPTSSAQTASVASLSVSEILSVHSCTYLSGSPNSLGRQLHAQHLQALPGMAALQGALCFPRAALRIHPQSPNLPHSWRPDEW